MLDRTSSICIRFIIIYLNDRIYECLLTAMAAVRAVDVHTSLLFMGNLNAIIRNGWVLLPPTVLGLWTSTLQLYQVVINW